MSISEQIHKNDFDMMTMTPKWSRETGTESCLSSVRANRRELHRVIVLGSELNTSLPFLPFKKIAKLLLVEELYPLPPLS